VLRSITATLASAVELLQRSMDEISVPAAVLHVQKEQDVLLSWHGGQAQDTEAVFSIASITKPLVCLAAARMVENGEFDLDDPVSKYFPEFGKAGKGRVTLRHLFTHSSGLPDFLPNNNLLRRNQAPLSEYFRETCAVPLKFRPGTDCSYQSMGILALSMVMQEVRQTSTCEILEEEIVRPASLRATSLVWSDEFVHKFCKPTPTEDVEGSWVWNTSYWRNLGAPWGGAFSTAPDIAKILEVLLQDGLCDGKRILQSHTVRTVLSNHTVLFPDMSQVAARRFGWGLGWSIVKSGRELHGGSGNFGALTPIGAFGHSGATGTICWADPKTGFSMVLLTNGKMPHVRQVLRRCCDIISELGRTPRTIPR